MTVRVRHRTNRLRHMAGAASVGVAAVGAAVVGGMVVGVAAVGVSAVGSPPAFAARYVPGLDGMVMNDASAPATGGMVEGPDGLMWFTSCDGGADGSISTSTANLSVTTYPDADGCPQQITAGPDGNLWYTSTATSNGSPASIAQITTAGTITHFTDAALDSPQGITAGPDGNLWFTDASGNQIGQLTTAGTFTFFTNPQVSDPQYITTGPDGNLWFTDAGNNTVGQITTSGSITVFSSALIDVPEGITAGPDGALWFVNSGNNTIGRITTTGTVSSYSASSIDAPQDITAGPDGALWFTNTGADFGKPSIGRITTSGSVFGYDGPPVNGGFIDDPVDIASGLNGELWFTDSPDRIGNLTTPKPPSAKRVAPSGAPVGLQVAIPGYNLSDASVTFNGQAASIMSDNNSRIVTTVPAGATSGPVTVTTPFGTATIASFTVLPSDPPVVTSVKPLRGRPGTRVTIRGDNLVGATVAFNGVHAYLRHVTDTVIATVVPRGATTGPITVTTLYGTATTAAFTVP